MFIANISSVNINDLNVHLKVAAIVVCDLMKESPADIRVDFFNDACECVMKIFLKKEDSFEFVENGDTATLFIKRVAEEDLKLTIKKSNLDEPFYRKKEADLMQSILKFYCYPNYKISAYVPVKKALKLSEEIKSFCFFREFEDE